MQKTEPKDKLERFLTISALLIAMLFTILTIAKSAKITSEEFNKFLNLNHYNDLLIK